MHDIDNRRSSYDGTLTKQRDPLEVKADAEQGLLTGYASKYWVVDSYGEVTAPGSFAQTIAERGPQGANRILLRYEHEYTIGVHNRMAEDGTGLYIEAKASDDGMYGTAVRRQLADGVPYGLSIGFRRISDRSATEDDRRYLDFSSAPSWVAQMPVEEIRVLTGVKLMENSVVSFPAVDPALIDSYRTSDKLTDEQIRDMIARAESHEMSDSLREYLSRFPDHTADLPTPEQVRNFLNLSAFEVDRALSQLRNVVDVPFIAAIRRAYAWPADASAGGSETLPTTTAQTAQRRNYVAEFELLTGVNL